MRCRIVRSEARSPGRNEQAKVGGVDHPVAVDVGQADAEFGCEQFPVGPIRVAVSVEVAGVTGRGWCREASGGDAYLSPRCSHDGRN